MEIAAKPIGVIIVQRHGRTQAWRQYPQNRQGEYPLTSQERTNMSKVGAAIFDFLWQQPELRAALKDRGIRIRGAPSPLVRAVQTVEETGGQIEKQLKEAGIDVQHAKMHLEPIGALSFLEPYPWPHYPPQGGFMERKQTRVEKQLEAGHDVYGMEKPASLRSRTRAARAMRDFLAHVIPKKGKRPIYLFHYGSHGTLQAPEALSAPAGPTGFALHHLFTPAERTRYNIPKELVRGEAVAAIVYSNGSIKARHVKP